MTPKDYKLISDTLKNSKEMLTPGQTAREALKSVVISLMYAFQADDPQFNMADFKQACGF